MVFRRSLSTTYRRPPTPLDTSVLPNSAEESCRKLLKTLDFSSQIVYNVRYNLEKCAYYEM